MAVGTSTAPRASIADVQELWSPVGTYLIDDFIEGYLAYETRAEDVLTAAVVDPSSCIANVYAGLLWMLLEAPGAAMHAAKYLA